MLSAFLVLVFLFALVGFLVGLLWPRGALFWSRVRTRRRSALIYGFLTVFSFLLIGQVSPRAPSTHEGIAQQSPTLLTTFTTSAPTSPAAGDTSLPSTTSVTMGSPTPRSLSYLSYLRLCTTYGQMTSLQQDALAASLRGQRLEGWIGEVEDVRPSLSSLSNNDTVDIDMTQCGPQMSFTAPASLALQLKRGEAVQFAGVVTNTPRGYWQILLTEAHPSSLPSPPLTGLGATVADWNTAHPTAQCYVSGVPSGPTVAVGKPPVRYEAVDCSSDPRGRIAGYTIQLATPLPLAQAEAVAQRELPVDVFTLWEESHLGCSAGIVYESPTLAALNRGIAVASARFTTYNLTGYTFDFDPNRVNRISIGFLHDFSPVRPNLC